METDLINAIMHVDDCGPEEAREIAEELADLVRLGEDPEQVLHDEGLEPDYVFDLINLL
mgnify:FL=1